MAVIYCSTFDSITSNNSSSHSRMRRSRDLPELEMSWELHSEGTQKGAVVLVPFSSLHSVCNKWSQKKTKGSPGLLIITSLPCYTMQEARGGGDGCITSGSGHTSSSCKTGNNGKEEGCGMVLKKGPWMAEEDEILIEYVRKHGPRDWSSIRSKGLLPRSGKSCRLRWVNKLKPDLKTGCKFSPEEERIVIDLQAQFGNKWARIATYLPGRTDNDVKNFWSTRQKRLARILRTPLPSRSNKNNGKVPVSSHEGPNFEDPSLHRILFEGDGRCNQEASKMTRMPPDIMTPVQLNLDTALPLLALELAMEKEPFLSDAAPPSQPPFDHLPHPLVDLPLPVLAEESPGLSPGFGDASFPGGLACPEEPSPEGMPFLGLDAGHDGIERVDEHPGATSDFFDDLPADMFDYLEPPPPPPPPPASSTSW